MGDLELYKTIFNVSGWFGLFLYLSFKYGNIFWKKKTGRWVSYENMMEKIEELEKSHMNHLINSEKNIGKVNLLEADLININQNLKEVKIILRDIQNHLINQRGNH